MYIPPAILYFLSVLIVLISFIIIRSRRKKGKNASFGFLFVFIITALTLVLLYQSRLFLIDAYAGMQYENNINAIIERDYDGVEPTSEDELREIRNEAFSLIEKPDPMDTFGRDLLIILILIPFLGFIIVGSKKELSENSQNLNKK